jgi:predicted ATP-dependent protease
VIIPAENERDLKEIPDNVKENLTIYPLKWMDDVLEIALERMPKPKLAAEDGGKAEAVSEPTQEVSEAGQGRQSKDGELPISPH